MQLVFGDPSRKAAAGFGRRKNLTDNANRLVALDQYSGYFRTKGRNRRTYPSCTCRVSFLSHFEPFPIIGMGPWHQGLSHISPVRVVHPGPAEWVSVPGLVNTDRNKLGKLPFVHSRTRATIENRHCSWMKTKHVLLRIDVLSILLLTIRPYITNGVWRPVYIISIPAVIHLNSKHALSK